MQTRLELVWVMSVGITKVLAEIKAFIHCVVHLGVVLSFQCVKCLSTHRRK